MKPQTAHQVLEKAIERSTARGWRTVANRLEEITSAPKYSEPGYSTEHPVILFGNWNNPVESKRDYSQTPTRHTYASKSAEREAEFFNRVCKRLEAKAECEWSDEWTTCEECGGAVRTSPTSYGWQPSYVQHEDGLICSECARKDPETVLASYEGKNTKCVPSDLGINPADHNYTKLDQRFENGLYGGQDADPKKIATALRKRGISRFLFVLDDVGQFDIKFSAWVHDDEKDKIPVGELPHVETACDLDPAEGLKRALQSAPMPSGPGITVTTCDTSTGTSVSRKVSPDEFGKGTSE